MQNNEKESLVLRENATNFFNWINNAKKRLNEEEELRLKQLRAQTEQKSDKAA